MQETQMQEKNAEAAELKTARVTLVLGGAGEAADGGETAATPEGGSAEAAPAEVPAPTDGGEAAPDGGDAGDDDEEEVDETEPAEAERVPKIPLLILIDRNNVRWAQVYCEGKKVAIKISQIAAMTMEPDGWHPYVHLANAKDVIRIDEVCWLALYKHLFPTAE